MNLLVLAAVLPLFLGFIYDIYQQARSGFERAKSDVQHLAKVASADAHGYFARTEQRLGDIARRVEVGSLDPARCKSLFADIETIDREYAGLAMIDRIGRVVCLAGGETDHSIEGLSAARPLMTQAEGPPRLLVGAPVKGAASGGWVLPLAYPVRGGEGLAAGMVIATAHLGRFQSLVTALELPEKPAMLIVKGGGMVIASSHDPDRHVGQSRRDDTLTRLILERHSGVMRGVSVDDVERFYGFQPIEGTDLIAIVGLDVAPVRWKVIESALTHGAYGLGVLALVLVLAFAVGRRISAPISALARASHAFGEGKQDVRATVSGAREVAEVAAQLNSMFSILVARERTLVETQEMLDILLDSMDRVLWSFTPDMSTVLFASESTRKVFGHDSSAFRANPGLWLELMHPDDRKLVEATADRIALSGTGAMEYRVLRPDGETRWVEVRWRHAAGGQGKTARMDGLVTDITERKQTEEENRQLLSIIEQSLNEIYVFDAATLSYEYANSSALHNLGYAFRHLRLLTPVDLMPQFTEGTVVGMVNQLLHREKPQQVFETTHRRADGSEYPVEVHLQTVEREGRWKCLAVVIDISERQHAHTEIIKLANSLERRVADRTTELARANAELESFVYSISHDLRTPLRAINGYAHILAEDLKERLDPGALAMLQRIAQGAVRMGELIDDLLTFSRVGRGDLSLMQVDMEAMARAIVEELRHENPQAQVSIQDMPKPVADPKLLRQVMLNLIGNALKFSSRQAEARIEIGSISEDGKPMYFVRDNGAGFDSAHASKLFGVFQRLHQESEFPGTGVGLAIVKRIVERHHGHVWAEAAPGKGATFYFTLP